MRLFAAVIVGLALLPMAASADILNHADEEIALEVGKGVLMRLPTPAANIFVANADVADVQVKSPRLVYLFGKKPGDTSLYALGRNDEVIHNAAVHVNHNLSRVNEAIKDFMPDAEVRMQSVKGTLVLAGHVSSAAAAEDLNRLALELVGEDKKIMNRVRVSGPNQVNLRVKIAEVARSVVKELGFNWQSSFAPGNDFFGIVTGSQVFDTVTDPVTGLPMKEFLALGKDTGSYIANVRTGNLDLNTLIDALETDGLVSILAEPNLTAMTGETASFLAGGEFPIPVPQEDNAITIEYKNFGVGLSFTPTILSDNNINLKVAPEVSQLSAAGALITNSFSIPSLTTRRAETTVELASGQSFAIAGLLQNEVSRDLSKLPGLGDIPILGTLFRSDSFQRNETELVIIVTPYLVTPVSAPKMALPTDGLKMPNDVERYLEGKSYEPQPLGKKPTPEGAGGRRLIGTAGFMLN